MTPLPAPLGGGRREAGALVAWRLDKDIYRATWDRGEGAYLAGGRWNSKGIRAVYCSIDPAAAILEVAVHKGFEALDTVPHVLTAITIADPAAVHVVDPGAVPNARWLQAGSPSGGQQSFGDALLARHKFVVVPSVVSSHSWNLIFIGAAAAGLYAVRLQERFALDTRLHPPR